RRATSPIGLAPFAGEPTAARSAPQRAPRRLHAQRIRRGAARDGRAGTRLRRPSVVRELSRPRRSPVNAVRLLARDRPRAGGGGGGGGSFRPPPPVLGRAVRPVRGPGRRPALRVPQPAPA